MRLTISLATRGRPELLKSTVETTLANVRDPNTRMVVLCDLDDTQTADMMRHYEGNVTVSIKEREDSLGAKYNRALTVAPADVYLAMVDYAPHVTAGFDRKIIEAAKLFPDGIGVVYDHMANLSFPGINAVTHGLAQKMGGIYPEHFPYWFIDHWLDDIAKMIGRIAAADVRIDTSRRPGTMERREVDFWASLFDAGTLERRKIASDIILSPDFQEPTWRRNMLLSALHLHEERSIILHQMLRAETLGPGPAPDDRYNRIKARAVETMRRWIGRMENHLADKKLDQPFGQHHPMEFMWFLAKARGAGSVLEVGSGFGHTLKMLGNVAADNAVVRSVDGEQRPQLGGVIEYLRSRGRDAEAEVPVGHRDYDIVFLNRDQARADWQSYGSLGKLVAIHNIARPGHEAHQLWPEIKASGLRTEEKVESHMGIGLVYRDAA